MSKISKPLRIPMIAKTSAEQAGHRDAKMNNKKFSNRKRNITFMMIRCWRKTPASLLGQLKMLKATDLMDQAFNNLLVNLKEMKAKTPLQPSNLLKQREYSNTNRTVRIPKWIRSECPLSKCRRSKLSMRAAITCKILPARIKNTLNLVLTTINYKTVKAPQSYRNET